MKTSAVIKLVMAIVFVVAALVIGAKLEAQEVKITMTPNPCTLRVHVQDKDGWSHGTGAFVGPQLVVTAWHVVKDRRGDKCFVDFPARSGVEGKVIAVHKKQDIALIELSERFKMMHLSLAIKLENGQPLIVEGYADSKKLENFKRGVGTLSSTRYGADRYEANATWFKVEDYGARSGDSGGPVYTLDGQYAGCLWGSVDGETYFTPAMIVFKFIVDNHNSDFPVPPGPPQPDLPPYIFHTN